MNGADQADGPDRARDGGVLFDAVLRPYRSLSRRGFLWLMTGACLASGLVGLVFLLRGAWPVFGFCGLEMAILYFALRHNFASARIWERLILSEKTLTVTKGGPAAKPGHWVLQPQWLTVDMADPPRHESQLCLSSGGRTLIVGRFLTPRERLEVAQALRDSLRRWRMPLHLRTS